MNKIFYMTSLITLLGTTNIAQAVTTDQTAPKQEPEGQKSLEQAREDARQKSIDSIRQQFKSMDIDNNGVVSKEEFVHFRIQDYTKKQEEVFNQLDKGGKGSFTVEEYEAAVEKMMIDLSNKIAEEMKKRMAASPKK